MSISIPKNVSRVTELLKNAGFEAFLVGGCVRDLIISEMFPVKQVSANNTDVSLETNINEHSINNHVSHETKQSDVSREPKDWDLTTNAIPAEIVKLFESNDFKVVYENNFGTVSVIFEDESLDSSIREIQITPYRIEGSYSDKRHPDSVSFSNNINDDLSRRDFTMNAIAINPENNTVIDPFHGKHAIEKQIIECVGNPTERFTEDALRIMRAIRFSAQLNFMVSSETMNAMIETKELLREISAERIRDEFIKIINSKHPAIAIGLMKQLGILEIVLPEIMPSIGCEQGGVHIYDVFDHLVHALQHAADKHYPFHVKLAALFHDIGKPKTRREGTKKAYTFYGHEVVGARIAVKIMERLKFPKADIEAVSKFVRWHMFFSDTEQITLSAVRRMIANMETKHISPTPQPGTTAASLDKLVRDSANHPIWELMQIRECDRVGMKKAEAPYRLRKYFAMIEECLRDPISVSQLKVDGNYLMNGLHVKPGPRMGWMLHALLEEVLEDPKKNTIEYLSNRVKQMESIPDNELKAMGEQGKKVKESADQEEVKKLHVKHNVDRKPKRK